MVKYLHIRQVNPDTGEITPSGGISVAYTCTLTEILLQVAACHDNDLFCYRIGREIASGRMKSKHHEPTIIPLTHPISMAIIDWLSLEWFEVPVNIYLDDKSRWVSTFQPDEGVSVVMDTDWENQVNLETSMELNPQ